METDAYKTRIRFGGDRWLLAIVAGIALIVVLSLVVVLTRPDVAYRPDGAPAATVHNYLLALQKDDLPRAHGYLSPGLASFPDDDQFEQQVNRGWRFSAVEEASFVIEESRVLNDGKVRVSVRETHYSSSGPFGGYQSADVFDMTLQEEAGGWHLVDGDKYWQTCWDDAVCR